MTSVDETHSVMAGLTPAIPILWTTRDSRIAVTGTSPVTSRGAGGYIPVRSFFVSAASGRYFAPSRYSKSTITPLPSFTAVLPT